MHACSNYAQKRVIRSAEVEVETQARERGKKKRFFRLSLFQELCPNFDPFIIVMDFVSVCVFLVKATFVKEAAAAISWREKKCN